MYKGSVILEAILLFDSIGVIKQFSKEIPEFGITIVPALKLSEMTHDSGFLNFIAKITS